MKKAICLCAALLVLPLLLSSCYAGNTTTDYARDHVYKLGDEIHFYDEKNNRNLLGTLTFLSVHVLSNDAFTLKVQDGKDSDGEPIYKDVPYRQLVQINYMYETTAGKPPRSFYVYDSGGGKGALKPDVPYNAIPVESGVSSLIAALPSAGNSVRVEVMYSGVFTPNATASLSFDGKAPSPEGAATLPQRETMPPATQNNAQQGTAPPATQNITPPETVPAAEQHPLSETELLQAQVEDKQQSIVSLSEQLNKKQNQITVLIVLLSIVGSVLFMLLWQQFRNRKRG